MSNARALWFVLVLAGCGGGYSTSPPPPPPAPAPPPPGGGNPSGTANVSMSSISDAYGTSANSFSPGTVTVTRSGTVTWTNSTGFVHNVTFATADGVPANIPDLPTGSASRTFSTAGTFNYQCTNHAGMSGKVTVQ